MSLSSLLGRIIIWRVLLITFKRLLSNSSFLDAATRVKLCYYIKGLCYVAIRFLRLCCPVSSIRITFSVLPVYILAKKTKKACTRRDHKKRRKDDQLFDSIIQLCIEDTFPYSNIYFKEYVGNVQDFECAPTKHLYTMMDIVMRVLRFDQCTRTRFQHKIHQKIEAHNASVCTRVDFQERHTRECIAQWQSDESDLRNANPANNI
eukprot:jgi/Picre1/33667/NNA_001146.t1